MRNQFLIGLAVAAIIAYSCVPDSGAVRIIAAGNAAELGYAPPISNERGIKVTVTRQNILSEAKTWNFQVTLE
ncbi:MAG: hypothetical protein WAW10_03575, partial [Gallionella sp.]